MKFNQNLMVRRFQEGGPMPEEQGAPMGPEGAPAPEEQGAPAPQGGNPEEQLRQIAGDLVNQLMQAFQDPQAVAAVLQMALEMVSQAGAPAQPAFQRMGGKLVRVK